MPIHLLKPIKPCFFSIIDCNAGLKKLWILGKTSAPIPQLAEIGEIGVSGYFEYLLFPLNPQNPHL